MNSNILCASGSELTVLATTFALYISELFNAEDLSTISNFIVLIGDTLALISNQKARCESSNSSEITSPTVDLK